MRRSPTRCSIRTANRAAWPFVDSVVSQDLSVYPGDDVLSKMTLMKPLPIDIVRLENRLWAQLKASVANRVKRLDFSGPLFAASHETTQHAVARLRR